MADLLVTRVLWRVSSTLADTKPQFTRFSERDMVAALQCGVRALCKYLPQAGVRTFSMQLASGTRQSIARISAQRLLDAGGLQPGGDVFGIYLQEVLRNKGADGLTPGRGITLVDRQRLDAIDPTWHASTGAAVLQYAYNPQDPLTFWVYPGVQGGVWVDVSMAAVPKAIPPGGAPTSEVYGWAKTPQSAETVGIDDQWEDELYHYCVAYLLLGDAKAQGALARAQLHVQAFNASINSIAQALTGHNPNLKALPFAPDVPGAAS